MAVGNKASPFATLNMYVCLRNSPPYTGIFCIEFEYEFDVVFRWDSFLYITLRALFCIFLFNAPVPSRHLFWHTSNSNRLYNFVSFSAIFFPLRFFLARKLKEFWKSSHNIRKNSIKYNLSLFSATLALRHSTTILNQLTDY